MKPIWKDICLAATMGLVIPGLVLGISVHIFPASDQREISGLSFTESEETPSETTASEARTDEKPMTVSVLLPEGNVQQMVLDDYLTGVVLAEMPVTFHLEALKAQAVVARTYTVRAAAGHSKHSDAAVCTDSSCCQAHLSEEDFLSKGGSVEGVEKVKSAILDTENQVLTYDGELIEATYFSCSGGSTEDAVAVWGTDVPYLQATDSPGEEAAAHYSDSVFFSKSEFARALGVTLQGSPATWIGAATYTAGGGVDTIRIGGKDFKGTAVRKALGLRSTAFTLDAAEDGITVTTKGFGHRVGMSQYGADAMATSGSTYLEILAHYYQGTELAAWQVDKGGIMG